MTGKMLVVFVKHTGHVLSAATVASPLVVPPAAADLVGDALTLWSIPGVPQTPLWSIAMPADALDVAVIEPKEELLASPFDWRIGTDRQAEQLQHLALPAPVVTQQAGPPKTIKLDLTPGFTGDGVDAVVFEQGATGPVQVYTGATSAGVAEIRYTGADAKTVLGFVREFPLVAKFF
jgi:hypothetical protein